MTTLAFPPRGEVQRIAVFRALALGDMLCAVPALRALRQAYPDAHITLVGLPWAQAFVDRYHALIDALMVFPGAVGFPEQRETDEGLPAFWEASRARQFDLAIQLQGSGGIANDIVLKMGARFTAGFHQPNEAARPGRFMPWPEELAESERFDALMRFIGVPVNDSRLHFPLCDADNAECDALAARLGIEFDRLVCVHPGARLPSRRWPVERFAQVADALAADGWQIALTGSAGEAALSAGVLGEMAGPALHTAGQTSLGGLGALVSRARLLVSNDTGLSHVAAGVRTPSVIVASGSDVQRWAPLDRGLHQVIADYPACRPCGYETCPIGHPCARNVDSAQVIAAARAKLAAYPAPTTYLNSTPSNRSLVHAA